MNIQLAAICLLLGAGIVFMFISLIGIARFPDFFMRLHAQGVGDTLGAFLILAGMMVAAGANLLSVKLLLIFVIIVLTNPLGTNLMMIAAVNKEDYQGYRTLLSGEQEQAGNSAEGEEGTETYDISSDSGETDDAVTANANETVYEDPETDAYSAELSDELGTEPESTEVSEKRESEKHNEQTAEANTDVHEEPENEDNESSAKRSSGNKRSRRKRKPSMSMNRGELVAAAEKRGITVPEGATKREILSLIYPDKELSGQ